MKMRVTLLVFISNYESMSKFFHLSKRDEPSMSELRFLVDFRFFFFKFNITIDAYV